MEKVQNWDTSHFQKPAYEIRGGRSNLLGKVFPLGLLSLQMGGQTLGYELF